MRMKIRFRNIQYRTSQNVHRVRAPTKNGSILGPKTPSTADPRLMRKLLSTKLREVSAITYAAIEFIPTTMSGNARR
jgi:hypothetical protein